MPRDYQDLETVRPNAPSRLTPGYRIMQAAARAGVTPANIGTEASMNALVAAFHGVLSTEFVWTPSQGGANGRIVLDGERRTGECRFLAEALRVLLISPAPYGFGVDAARVTVATYDSGGNGFIARHVGVHYGLSACVVDPANRARTDYYRWGDHKVVRFIDRYWDVCYNTAYAQLADMAYYTFSNAYLLPGGENMEFVANRGVVEHYFKMNDEFPDMGAITTIGPYMVSQVETYGNRPPVVVPRPPQVRKKKEGCRCVIL